MSEQDKDSQTEEPTQRKLEQAREKGQIVSSKEISTWAVLLAGALAVVMVFPGMLGDLKDAFLPFIARPHDMPVDMVPVHQLLLDMLGKLALAMGLFLVLVAVLAILSHIVQHGFMIAPELIQPKLEKISPLKGLKRMFSAKSLVEFAKGVFKIVLVGTILSLILSPIFEKAGLFVGVEPGTLLDKTQDIVLRLFVAVLSVLIVIAGLDFLYQKFDFLKSQRMSIQELKEEFKQTEGDPHIKGKLKQIRQEKAKKRMMAAVPTATLVVTNPTHFAVALKYEHGQTQAPIVVAKGVDAVALKIREVAKEHDVPVIENPPLARALYDSADVDEEIPLEQYKAVAALIGYVMRLNKKLGKKI